MHKYCDSQYIGTLHTSLNLCACVQRISRISPSFVIICFWLCTIWAIIVVKLIQNALWIFIHLRIYTLHTRIHRTPTHANAVVPVLCVAYIYSVKIGESTNFQHFSSTILTVAVADEIVRKCFFFSFDFEMTVNVRG